MGLLYLPDKTTLLTGPIIFVCFHVNSRGRDTLQGVSSFAGSGYSNISVKLQSGFVHLKNRGYSRRYMLAGLTQLKLEISNSSLETVMKKKAVVYHGISAEKATEASINSESSRIPQEYFKVVDLESYYAMVLGF